MLIFNRKYSIAYQTDFLLLFTSKLHRGVYSHVIYPIVLQAIDNGDLSASSATSLKHFPPKFSVMTICGHIGNL